ncbi:MAG: multiprotein bridging factor aMBF1 [Candidatus Micrarchaeaceae archaeon]
MEECELCGRKITTVYVIEIEGTTLRVCGNCAKGNKVIKVESAEKKGAKEAKAKEAEKSKEASESELAEDYGKRIREARERMKLPLGVLAEMMNEKESFLLRIEEQKAMPSPELAKKLEKALGIKLEENVANPSYRGGKKENATMGEFFKG